MLRGLLEPAREYARQRPTERLDAALARVARAQEGLISRGQAIDAGASGHFIDSRLRSGRWKAVRRNVYLLGPVAPSPTQARLSACLSYGTGVFVSSLAAADEWALERCRIGGIELVTTRDIRSRDADVRLRRTRTLPPYDVTKKGRLPLTTPLRTLIDIAETLSVEELEFPFEDVLRRGLVSPALLQRRVTNTPLRGRSGVKKLRSLMKDDGPRTQSALEVIVKQAVAQGRLPAPARQYVVLDWDGTFVARVDFAYPHARLAIEAHSWRFHIGRDPWEGDVDRGNRLQAAGWDVVYVTRRQIDEGSDAVVAMIRRHLGGQLPGLCG